MYKMFNITKETLENNDIEVIVHSVNALWLNEENIEEKLGHKNLLNERVILTGWETVKKIEHFM